MTKEITKVRILQELQDKFALREFVPANFLFDETVVPVYDIQQHLQRWGSNQYVRNVTATGPVAVVIVPENEKWKLRAYSVVFLTGAFTIAGMYILRNLQDSAADFSYLDLTAAQSVSYLRTMSEAVVLETGDTLLFNVDGFTTTGTVQINLDLMKEEIR